MSKSYKKAVTIGVAAFSAVALLTTGAAAFVLSNQVTGNKSDTITVEKVIDAGLKLTLNEIQDDFIVDADKGDTSGRVQYDGDTTPNYTVTISGKFEKADSTNEANLADLIAGYKFTFDFAIADGAQKTFFDTHVSTLNNEKNENEYLRLNYADTKLASGSQNKGLVSLTADTNKFIVDGTSGEFAFTLTLAWGQAFGNVNPSLYFDAAGSATSMDTVKSMLNNLYTFNGGSYTVTINAKVA